MGIDCVSRNFEDLFVRRLLINTSRMPPILAKVGSEKMVRKLLASLFDKREKDEVKTMVVDIHRHLMENCAPTLFLGLDTVSSFSGARRFDRADVRELFDLVTKGLTFGLREEAIRVIEKSAENICELWTPSFTHDDAIYIITTFVTFATNNPKCMSDALAA